MPDSQSEAEYLSERKFSLVNGMHAVLAFLVYPHTSISPHTSPPGMHTVLAFLTLRCSCDLAAAPDARQQYVLSKHPEMAQCVRTPSPCR